MYQRILKEYLGAGKSSDDVPSPTSNFLHNFQLKGMQLRKNVMPHPSTPDPENRPTTTLLQTLSLINKMHRKQQTPCFNGALVPEKRPKTPRKCAALPLTIQKCEIPLQAVRHKRPGTREIERPSPVNKGWRRTRLVQIQSIDFEQIIDVEPSPKVKPTPVQRLRRKSMAAMRVKPQMEIAPQIPGIIEDIQIQVALEPVDEPEVDIGELCM